jgi:DNA replication protein DnaC
MKKLKMLLIKNKTMNKKDYLRSIPRKFAGVDYDNDVPGNIKEAMTNQIRNRMGLYLFGTPGVGKTHIACALAKKVIDENYPVMFLNTTEMLEKFRQNFGKELEGDEEDLFNEIMEFEGVIFMDDIGAEKASEWTRERLCLIINKKYEDMFPNLDKKHFDTFLISELEIKINEMIDIMNKKK